MSTILEVIQGRSPFMVYMGRNLISKNTEEGFWTKLEPEVPPAHQVSH